MGSIQAISRASDRVMDTLISGLELEFGRGAAEGLAQRFLAAEECDLLWDARADGRWIGAYESDEQDGFELDRVAICGRIDGHWFAAMCIVDGDGQVHGMTGKRQFRSARAAWQAFEMAH
jgi:hypothetical protein